MTAAPFPMLTDLDNAYALSLSLAFSLTNEMKTFFTNFGLDLPRYQGSEAWMLLNPATFVVGTVRFVDPDYRIKRMAIEDLLDAH